MGYNVESSLNILKHTNITEVQNKIKEIVNDSFCNFFYDNYDEPVDFLPYSLTCTPVFFLISVLT